MTNKNNNINQEELISSLNNQLEESEQLINEIEKMALNVPSLSGEEYLNEICKQFISLLDVDYSMIGNFYENEHKVKANFVYSKKGQLAPFEYLLEGTPCKNVVGNEICIYNGGVTNLFPDDLILKDLKIEAYMGIPLFDFNKKPIGIVVLMNCQAFKNTRYNVRLVNIFSALISKELIRLQTEDKIIQNEKKYKALFQNAPLPYQSLAPDGTILEVNNIWLEQMGYNKNEDVVGKNIINFIHPNYHKNLEANFSKFMKNGFIKDAEFKMLRKDGSTFYIQNNGVFNYNEDKSPKQSFCLFHDVSDIFKEREELYEEIDLKNMLLDHTPNNVYIFDIKNNKNVFSNGRINDILGYSVEDIKQMGSQVLQTLMHPDDFETYLTDIYPKYFELNKGEFIVHEYRMKNKAGGWCWIKSQEVIFEWDKNNLPYKIFGIAEDISDTREAERQLSLSENKYRTLVERANDGIVILQNRKFIFTNEMFCKMTKTKQEDILGKDFTDFLPESEKEKVNKNYENRLKGGKAPLVYESKIIDSEANELNIEISAGMIDYLGEPANLIFIHNIKNRVETRNKLLVKLDEIERQNKLMISREHKMIELKKEINELRKKININDEYKIPNL